ncbi:MAG: hypothetical protein CMO40_04285 [Verrucomicrobiaceae bacterium]|nr:hypothetical protein [Verrucomicrobiaceae bacterium]
MSSSAANSPSDTPELIPLPTERARVTELTGAVRDLGDAASIENNGCSALVRKIRLLFPELMQLRGDQDATIELRDRQVAGLTPFLLGTNVLEGDSQGARDKSEREPHENPLDEVTRRMWEISVTEQQIESYRAQEQSMRDTILASVSAEHVPLIRWALTQA